MNSDWSDRDADWLFLGRLVISDVLTLTPQPLLSICRQKWVSVRAKVWGSLARVEGTLWRHPPSGGGEVWAWRWRASRGNWMWTGGMNQRYRTRPYYTLDHCLYVNSLIWLFTVIVCYCLLYLCICAYTSFFFYSFGLASKYTVHFCASLSAQCNRTGRVVSRMFHWDSRFRWAERLDAYWGGNRTCTVTYIDWCGWRNQFIHLQKKIGMYDWRWSIAFTKVVCVCVCRCLWTEKVEDWRWDRLLLWRSSASCSPLQGVCDLM